MSGKEKKRHVRELLAILCVAVFLAAGVWYLKDQREKRERDASVSEESQKLQEQEEMTASSEMIQDSENQDREEQESQEQKSMVTPTAAPETTAEPELTEEEKSGGIYRGINWADSVGDQIIVCQMDAIEVKDAAGQTVRSFSDLGRLSRGSDTVYTNGFMSGMRRLQRMGLQLSGSWIWKQEIKKQCWNWESGIPLLGSTVNICIISCLGQMNLKTL